MKKLIIAAVLISMMIFLPPKLFAVVYMLFLFMYIMKMIVQYVKDEKAEHPWLALSSYPEIIPVSEVEDGTDREVGVNKFAFKALERFLLYVNLLSAFICLALLIYISMKVVRNPVNQMIAVAYSSLIMLPMAHVYFEKIVKHKNMENPFGIRGVYVGYTKGNITPTSLFFKRPSKTTYECLFAQVLINGKTHNVLCEKEVINELTVDEEVYVYSRISNSEEILGIGGEEEAPCEEDLVKDVEKDAIN